MTVSDLICEINQRCGADITREGLIEYLWWLQDETVCQFVEMWEEDGHMSLILRISGDMYALHTRDGKVLSEDLYVVSEKRYLKRV